MADQDHITHSILSDREPVTIKSDDERLAVEFLNGQFIEQPSGWVSHQYLEPGSDQERRAKAALARLLCSAEPLDEYIRLRLAQLFDPDFRGDERELVLKNRFRGKRGDSRRDRALVRDIALKLARGIKMESAIGDAMAYFNVDRSTVFRAWKAYGEKVWCEMVQTNGRIGF